VAPLPFSPRVRRYALLGLPLGAVAVVFAWDGAVGRIGSYAYIATMTLGAAAILTPLRIADPGTLRPAMVAMLAALLVVLVLARRNGVLTRTDGAVLLGGYAAFVLVVVGT